MNLERFGFLPLFVVFLIVFFGGGASFKSWMLGMAAALFALLYGVVIRVRDLNGSTRPKNDLEPGLYGVYSVQTVDSGTSILVLVHRANQKDATKDDYFLCKFPAKAVVRTDQYPDSLSVREEGNFKHLSLLQTREREGT